MNLFLCILAVLSVFSVSSSEIDTRIGSTAADSPTASIFGAGGEVFGNTIPCVTVPNGMTYWTPQTVTSDKKGVAPYRYDAPQWAGFRASHWLDGSATQDYGSFSILPDCQYVPMDHSLEVAQPAYYRYGGYELTAYGRSAILRLDCKRVAIVVNTSYDDANIAYDEEKGELRAENPVHRIYQGWGKAAGFSGWAVFRFNKKVRSVLALGDKRIELEFEDVPGPLMVRVGTSFHSWDSADANLEGEIPNWDFEAVRSAVEAIWTKRLSQVEVSGGDPEVRKHFYTSLWRASLSPRQVNDLGCESDYDDFSLWDTFRALHPLHTILHPRQSGEMMQALVKKYERGGWMPIFPMWGSYTSAMIGDHAASVIADAYTKGIRNFDVRKAWEGVRKNAFETPSPELYEDGRGRRALDTYLRLGYLPLEEPVRHAFHAKEQSSRTLEYAYDDWCASLLARDLGTQQDYEALSHRAGNWRNVFDPRTRSVQGRHEDGSFLNEDNYLKKTSFITEGTPCHYSWFVPHDVPGLIDFVGRELFEERLDLMFSESRYWHGNEPCHQVAYLYDYIGCPEKCQSAVTNILRTEYRNTPGGLSGNDDSGQLSSWYVFSCLGFYPVCPGSGEYALGIPAFDKIILHLENGRNFTIVKKKNAKTGFMLDGKRLPRPFLSHKNLVAGRRLVFLFPELEARK